MPQFGMPMSRSKTSWQTQVYKYFDIEVKGQGYTEFMNVRDISYYGNTLTCQTKYGNVKGRKSWCPNTNPYVINPINLTLRSKVNIVSGSWMYVIHTFMVIDPCAKYGKPMSIQKLLWAGHKNMSKPIYIWPWDQSARSYLDHECTRHIFLIWYTHVSNMVIDPCAKYGKPMSNQKIVMGWT